MPSNRMNIRIEPLASPRPAHFPETLGFGRDFTNTIDFLGTPGNDPLTGTAAPEGLDPSTAGLVARLRRAEARERSEKD